MGSLPVAGRPGLRCLGLADIDLGMVTAYPKWMTAATPMVGRRFGRLVVLLSGDPLISPSGRSRPRSLVRCDCGTEKLVSGEHLRAGSIRSCGCLQREIATTTRATHGDTRPTKGGMSREYAAYANAIDRCTNPRNKDYHHYGARGVTFCQRWRQGDGERSGYECFLSDMGRKPSSRHSLDRIDVNGNYEPGNCRWATWKEQRHNRRDAKG